MDGYSRGSKCFSESAAGKAFKVFPLTFEETNGAKV